MVSRKSILVLTSLYPDLYFKTNTTPVVHYFCKEWVKAGHKVLVIHNQNKFPLLFYILPKFLKNLIESFLAVRIPNLDQRKNFKFELDNVSIYQFPILKIIPFSKNSNRAIDKQLRKIILACEDNNFVPDFILGHWEYPQLPLISKLKKKYNFAVTSLVFHGFIYTKKY